MNKMRIFSTIAWFLLLMVSLAYDQTLPKYFWYIYVVDSNSPVGACTSLKYDSKGFPHIAYRGMSDAINGSRIKYAVYNGSTWKFTVIDTFPRAQGRVAMDLDNSDHPHIIYHSNDGEVLVHAYFDGIFWTDNVVDNALLESLYYWINIKIDSDDMVKMAYAAYYVAFSRNRMSYNTFNGTSYSGRTLIDDHDVWSGKWNSLTLDSQDQPAVAYWLDSGDLVFANLDQGLWKTELIDSSGFANDQGFFPTIIYGTDQKYYISFQSHTQRKLRLASGNSGNWSLEDITDLNGWTTFSTTSPMVLDDQNNPYIAFYEFEDNVLKLTYKMEEIWNIETVDTSSNCGLYASIDLTSDGLPAVSYLDPINGYLKLAVASLTPPPDSDGDGLPDYLEMALGTNTLDLDSDDDGLSDFAEDTNHNGVIESSETSPINLDTDNDGLQDGLELGVTSGIVAPPGLLGTNLSIFTPDLDPTTKTNPLKFDTDRDDLSDGAEDVNGNGSEDFDETNPNNPDTDGDILADGLELLAGTSPLDVDTDDDGISDSDEDINYNGSVDIGETSPALFDSDSDSLSDGLEKGISVPIPDPDGSGKILGTDNSKFIPDQDPVTQTDPLLLDTDFDGLSDGQEDSNINGKMDPWEPDPLDSDSDNDQLIDGIEVSVGSDPLDVDTDDDGIEDSFEDVNLNGIVDIDETSLILFDTDNDGVSDGVEIGKTEGIPDPDGDGRLKGTNTNTFIADQDPSINSDPLIWDTDGDGLPEGEEDVNFDGAVNLNETHFLLWDTDNDTLSDGDEVSFQSDPLNSNSKAAIDTLVEERLDAPPIPSGWTIVDEGENEKPSNWFIWGNALTQGSEIYGGDVNTGGEDPDKPGTYILVSNFSGTHYKITFEMRSNNIGSLGIMFNYTNGNNYYRTSMNREKSYRRVTKKVSGVSSVLELNQFTFELERFYEIIIFTVSGRIQVYFDKIRIFDIKDNSLTGGSFAFYSWKNPMSMFRNLSVVGTAGTTGIETPAGSNISDFQIGNNNGKGVISWKVINNPLIYSIELLRGEQTKYVSLDKVYVGEVSSPYLEGGYTDINPWLAETYKLVLYDHNNDVIEEKISANSPANINAFSLAEPFPNPTEGKLNMVFQSPEHVLLKFQIYDVLGRMVRKFDTAQYQMSWKQVVWDGRDASGNSVSKGIYIIKVQAISLGHPNKILWQDVKKIVRIK